MSGRPKTTKAAPKSGLAWLEPMVGAIGFEPTTPSSRTRSAHGDMQRYQLLKLANPTRRSPLIRLDAVVSLARHWPVRGSCSERVLLVYADQLTSAALHGVPPGRFQTSCGEELLVDS